MGQITNISLSLHLSPQMVAIGIALFVVLLILLSIGNHRSRRRRRGGSNAPRSRASGGIRKRDHGLETARRHGKTRSPHWAHVEKEHLSKEPACMACGYRGKGLQVHHIKPFHLHPHLELEPTNLITLCEVKGRDHHLLLGHLDQWASYNEHVREDVKRHHGKSAKQIRADQAWLRAVAKRP